MGFIGSMFNQSNGSGFKAGRTDIAAPTTADQANQTYAESQQGLSQQQQFLNALQAQNGIANQSAVYNQLQGVANGTGPNPAQAALNQNTGQNVANQAALMAGQRGAGSNVGLLARQAAQQGANTQQQAVGQGATMQANQSLGALGQLSGLATNQVNQQQNATNAYSQAAQGEQGQVLGAIQGQNQANVSMQSNINNANAGIAQSNIGAQQGLIGGVLGGVGSAVTAIGRAYGGKIKNMADGGIAMNNNLLSDSAVNAQNAANSQAAAQISALNKIAPPSVGGPKSNVGKYLNSFNSGQPNNLQSGVTSLLGSAINAGIRGASSLFSDDSSKVNPATDITVNASDLNHGFKADNTSEKSAPDMSSMPASSSDTMTAAHGGKVPAMLSPGEKYLRPKEAEEVAKGKKSVKEAGKTVPGKPDGKKDSLKNDTVPAVLDEGGFVIPNSIMQGKDPERGAAAFVRAHMSKSMKLKGGRR